MVHPAGSLLNFSSDFQAIMLTSIAIWDGQNKLRESESSFRHEKWGSTTVKHECQASFFHNDRAWGFLDLVAGGQSYLLFSTVK